MDHEAGRIRLDRLLFTATRHPADYGYVDHVLGLDGERLDALVIIGERPPRLRHPRPA
jgi:inorganic pyrophosphatase